MAGEAIRLRDTRPDAVAGFVLLAALLLIWASVALHLAQFRADLRHAAETRADLVADGLAESASLGVAQADRMLRYGATLQALAPLLAADDSGANGPEANRPEANGPGANWLATTDFGMPPGMWAALIDPSGRVATLSPGEGLITPAAQQARAHFTAHPGPDLFASAVAGAGPVSAAWAPPPKLAFARMLTGPNGAFAGSVVVLVDPMTLLQAARSLDVGAHGRVALIGPDWTELAAIGDAPADDGSRQATAPAFVFRERSLLEGALRIRVGLAEADVFVPFTAEWMGSVLIGLAMSLLCGVLAWLAMHRRFAALQAQRLMRAVLAGLAVGQGVIVTDRRGTVVAASPQAMAVIGVRVLHPVGQDLRSLPGRSAWFSAAWSQGGRFRRRDGAMVDVALYRQTDGTTVRFCRTIDGWLQMERAMLAAGQAAEAAVAARVHLVETLNHDIRAALHTIRGSVVLLRQSGLTLPQSAQVQQIDGATDALLAVVTALQDETATLGAATLVSPGALVVDDDASGLVAAA